VRVRQERFFILVAFVFLGGVSADLHAADEKAVELAKREERVSFYTSMAATESQLLAGAFQAKYPSLRVEITRLSTDKLLQRIVTEHRAGSDFF
jgi:ABC-type glycerol-3-phosphate transport system substrate-binding protein